jgi:nitroimidazol reductase NimA-like FMN-containing flavoprotein (pyridoxamine 5'-phosphate oxidase superfamily)
MRQKKKEIRDKNVIIDLLNTCHVGRLGTIGKDGYPVVKPLNFAYTEGRIYFHSAKAGEKIEDIERDNRVCFEIDMPIAYVKGTADNPCRAEYLYRSIIVKGRANIVGGEEERRAALGQLMKKYQPDGGYGEFPEAKLAITAVVRIDIESMTGKEDLGKDHMKDAVLKALSVDAKLPMVMESD